MAVYTPLHPGSHGYRRKDRWACPPGRDACASPPPAFDKSESQDAGSHSLTQAGLWQHPTRPLIPGPAISGVARPAEDQSQRRPSLATSWARRQVSHTSQNVRVGCNLSFPGCASPALSPDTSQPRHTPPTPGAAPETHAQQNPGFWKPNRGSLPGCAANHGACSAPSRGFPGAGEGAEFN